MSYGELILVVGDMHVPSRAAHIPPKFKQMLVPDKMQKVVGLGNFCGAEQIDFLRKVAPSVYCVKGEADDYELASTLPEELVFQAGDFKIGVCHGHQIVPQGDLEALHVLARRLDVDILITGSTHVQETVEYEGKIFINPGSITGAYTPWCDFIKPSFICMSIQNQTLTNYVYELNAFGEVDVLKTKFTKKISYNSHDNVLPIVSTLAAAAVAKAATTTPSPAPSTIKTPNTASSLSPSPIPARATNDKNGGKATTMTTNTTGSAAKKPAPPTRTVNNVTAMDEAAIAAQMFSSPPPPPPPPPPVSVVAPAAAPTTAAATNTVERDDSEKNVTSGSDEVMMRTTSAEAETVTAPRLESTLVGDGNDENAEHSHDAAEMEETTRTTQTREETQEDEGGEEKEPINNDSYNNKVDGGERWDDV